MAGPDPAWGSSSRPRRLDEISGMDLLIIMALTGLLGAGTVIHARRAWRAACSRHWPESRGVVESSVPVMAYRNKTRTWVPRIAYAYKVGGRTYRAEEMSFGKERWYADNQGPARDHCNEYPVGRKVTVYHHPERPEVACLERAEGSIARGYAFAGALGIGSVTMFCFLLSALLG